MDERFDPYYRWLGIPPEEQPPDLYRLLGLRRFEDDPEVISNAADRQMRHVRTFQTGPRAAECQQVLNALAAARTTLLNPEKKSAYDRTLAASGGASRASPPLPASGVAMPVAQPYPAPQPRMMAPAAPLYHQPVAPTTAQPHPLAAQPQPVAMPAHPAAMPAPVVHDPNLASGSGRGRRLRHARRSPVWKLVEIGVGGVIGLGIGVAVLWYGFGVDPLNLMQIGTHSGEVAQASASSDNDLSEKPQNDAPAAPAAPRSDETDEVPPAANNDGSSVSSSPTSAPDENDVDDEPSSPVTTPQQPVRAVPNRAPLGGRWEPKRKHPAPTAQEQREARKQVEETLGDDFKPGTTLAERQARFLRLEQVADQIDDDPAVLFVLLEEAYVQAGELRRFADAAKIVDRIVDRFEVDEIGARSKLVQDFAQLRSLSPTDRMTVVGAALTVAELAYKQERYDEASRLATLAEEQAASARNAVARTTARERANEYKRAARAKEAYERALVTLEANPEDAAAHLTVGKYLTLAQGNFKEGIPHLLLSDHLKLRGVAQFDQSAPTSPEQQLALADAWYDLASTESELAPLYARARHWYRQAQQGASGLAMVKINSRLEAIRQAEAAGKFVDRTGSQITDEQEDASRSGATPSRARPNNRFRTRSASPAESAFG